MATRPFAVSSPGFWRAYLVTLRPYLLFVSGAAGLLGLALGEPAPLPLAAAFAAFFLSYGLGQALTDVFQRDTDALSAPYRPLVRGELDPRAVLALSLAGLGACGAVFAGLDPRTLPLTAAATAGLATYTPLKRRWWGGPPWNSGIMALLPPIGWLCAGAPPAAAGACAWAAASVFWSYAVFVVLGYFKDVEADRATGYVTLPVRFGRRPALAASAVAAALGLAASARLVWLAAPAPADIRGLVAVALWARGAVLLGRAHVRLAPTLTDAEAHPGIADSVRGFVALHLGAAALLRPALAMPALLLAVLLEAALAARPCREQV